MRPIIGIVGRPGISGEDNLKLILSTDETRKAIVNHGGIPIIITPTQNMIYHKNLETPLTLEDMEILDTQISLCDGLVMPGGYRIYYYDKYICQKANELNIPLLGICMGMQIMCNYNNDNKNYKVEGHRSSEENFKHEVTLDKKSKLYEIIQEEKILVNSFHSYTVQNSGSYTISALADGKVIEAVEKKDSLFNIGIQWHPEKLNDTPSDKILDAFISATREYNKLK